MKQQANDLRSRHDQRLHEHEAHNDDAHAAQAEQIRSYIFTRVGQTIEQYVKLRGNTHAIEEYLEAWVFGAYWQSNTTWALSPESREMLKSGEYVWQEYMQSDGLTDWAAPAIQYCRALELGGAIDKATAITLRTLVLGTRDKIGIRGWVAAHVQPVL
ncbi:hypothetical protein OSCT_1217 [Oscillochloris trichoides DG-6]|uniref:Uncharacterized protein n=1 Tax=Oscillochloris trichoides DG-6 TaxID=765420 RepID=E1ID16_9CHLR|nr:hypothetical protein [Oscillochloris trichoides]EFO80925.1 hypothetical protein OSCT_1217 [Oscillochloris trichoides DG-6]